MEVRGKRPLLGGGRSRRSTKGVGHATGGGHASDMDDTWKGKRNREADVSGDEALGWIFGGWKEKVRWRRRLCMSVLEGTTSE